MRHLLLIALLSSCITGQVSFVEPVLFLNDSKPEPPPASPVFEASTTAKETTTTVAVATTTTGNSNAETTTFVETTIPLGQQVSTMATTILSGTTSSVASSSTSTVQTTVETTTTAPAFSNVVFSEVYYDPVGNEADEEWLEIYNPTGNQISMENWTISDNSGTWKFPPAFISPNSYLSIARDAAAFQSISSCPPDLSGFTRSLNNGGDQLSLKDIDGSEIDFVAWEGGYNDTHTSWSVSAQEGKTISRAALEDTGSAADWSETLPSPCH